MRLRNVDVLIIGGGQSGLGMGYFLKKYDIDFLIADGADRRGDSWRRRWDSLTLFTPASFCSLPGLEFTGDPHALPGKDKMADYLEAYAEHFVLPIELKSRITRLKRQDNGFVASTSKGDITARRVVIASGPFDSPDLPDFSKNLDRSVWQIHSSAYKNPAALPDGSVAIVGRGNSGAQIALELSASREVTVISDKDLLSLPQYVLRKNIFWWLKLGGILNAKPGGWWFKKIKNRGDILIGRSYREAVKSGRIKTVKARVIDAQTNQLILSSGKKIKPSGVIWATGYKPSYKWVEIAGALSPNGLPVHHRGESPVSGLFWMGMPWQTSLKSSLVYGVSEDARIIAGKLSET